MWVLERSLKTKRPRTIDRRESVEGRRVFVVPSGFGVLVPLGGENRGV